MKNAIDSMTAVPAIDQEEFANRKLIRPSLNRNDHNHNHNHMRPTGPVLERRERPVTDRGERPERVERVERNGGGKKTPPAEQTNAENFYYQKQMQTKTPMVIVLRDGEKVHGVIEWYDKACIKITRSGAPNLMIYKPAIKYMFKEGENGQ